MRNIISGASRLYGRRKNPKTPLDAIKPKLEMKTVPGNQVLRKAMA